LETTKGMPSGALLLPILFVFSRFRAFVIYCRCNPVFAPQRARMKLTSLPQFARNANRVREIVTILSKHGLADGISRLDLEFARGFLKGRDGAGLVSLTLEA